MSLLGWFSLGDSGQEGPSLSGRGLNTSLSPEAMKTVGLASDGAQLIDSGLSNEVVEAIDHSRAPFTRKQYSLKCRVFTSWCRNRLLDPVDCPLGTVLSSCRSGSLQGWPPPPFVAAYHIPLGGVSLGRDPLVSDFLLGVSDQDRTGALVSMEAWV